MPRAPEGTTYLVTVWTIDGADTWRIVMTNGKWRLSRRSWFFESVDYTRLNDAKNRIRQEYERYAYYDWQIERVH